MITPYVEEINAIEVDYLAKRDIEVLKTLGPNITLDTDIYRVSPAYLRDLSVAASTDYPDADAIFISCGALRTCDVVDEIEAGSGKPCVCSNQAMLWHCLRLAGVDDHLA